MTAFESLKRELQANPKTWLITGVAGFIGSNLLEALLKLDQRVVGLDNFTTGYQCNLEEVESLVTPRQWANFQFIQGDIRNLDDCRRAVQWRYLAPCALSSESQNESVAFVLHQAALGSVPRSVDDPITTNQNNIDGFLNMLVAARDADVRRFVYAASSSTYGDHPDLPKVEEKIGNPLSPYAVTKLVNELYADVFARSYGFKTIGLRYFNIFGRRQDPDGAYAAVIPKWIAAMTRNEPVYINGDGETSRDFSYVDNAVQANLLAATACLPLTAGEGLHLNSGPPEVEGLGKRAAPDPTNQVYNVAVGDRTTLNDLYRHLRDNLASQFPHLQAAQPVYRDFRAGDVRHSQADVSKAKRLLGYAPTHRLAEGLAEAMGWYVRLR